MVSSVPFPEKWTSGRKWQQWDPSQVYIYYKEERIFLSIKIAVRGIIAVCKESGIRLRILRVAAEARSRETFGNSQRVVISDTRKDINLLQLGNSLASRQAKQRNSSNQYAIRGVTVSL